MHRFCKITHSGLHGANLTGFLRVNYSNNTEDISWSFTGKTEKLYLLGDGDEKAQTTR